MTSTQHWVILLILATVGIVTFVVYLREPDDLSQMNFIPDSNMRPSNYCDENEKEPSLES